MGNYAKGFTAVSTGIVTVMMQYSDAFCTTWWPAVIALLGAVGVIAVPNAAKSDATK